MKQRIFMLPFLLGALMLVGQSCGSAPDGGVFMTWDQAENWEQKVFMSQEGKNTVTIGNVDVQKIEVDPQNSDVVYLATKASGVFKSNTKGEQWWQLGISPDRIRDIDVDPTDSNNVFTVRGSDIIRSTDGGEYWEIVYTDSQGAIITRLDIDWYDPERIVAVTSIGTVLLSEDRGENWRVVFQVNEPLIGVDISLEDSRVIYITELDRAIYRSKDGGQQWVNLFEKPAFVEGDLKGATVVKHMTMDVNDADTIYAVTTLGILKSTNGGQQWEFIDTLIERGAGENAAITSIATIPGQPEKLIFTVGRIIHKSVDYGQTWKTIENFPSVRKLTTVVPDPFNPDILFAGVEQVEEEQRGLIKR